MTDLIAVYAGSFDPVTLGHLDLIERAAQIFRNVIVAIGRHPTKKAFFTFQELSYGATMAWLLFGIASWC